MKKGIAHDIIGLQGEKFAYGITASKKNEYLSKRLNDIDIFLASIKANMRAGNILSSKNFNRLGDILVDLANIENSLKED